MNGLADEYCDRRSRVLIGIADRLQSRLSSYFEGIPRIDRVCARAKSVRSFLDKANRLENGAPKYLEPLSEIQDQIGARVIVYYRSDVNPASEIVERYFKPIERQVKEPESEREFDYSGKHYILILPSDLVPGGIPDAERPGVFELQIKTLFEHAWSEANHDLGFKPGTPLPKGAARKLAFAAAQAWGADQIFEELASLGDRVDTQEDGEFADTAHDGQT